MNKYQCIKTERVCYSYDQWLRTEVIKLPECLGCRSNREKPENTGNQQVSSIDQPDKRPSD
ncbi:MAG: hypothetical protein LBC20_03000 [Planctomycetaceae bacterium]|nr:hypothetical protein [Planctomycetaceae bacterium]